MNDESGQEKADISKRDGAVTITGLVFNFDIRYLERPG